MQNKFKKIGIITLSLITIFPMSCFASVLTNVENYNEGGMEYIKKTYSVSSEEEENFLSEIDTKFKVNNIEYEIVNKAKTGGDYTEKINISTTKNLETNSNKLDDVLRLLPSEIDYNENGYSGKYQLDINSIKVENHFNGYRDVLVEETKTYENLDKNDLDNIPKQIIKDGKTFDLITTNWQVVENIEIGENLVPSKFTAICNYATTQTIQNPVTYSVTAQYDGIAEKIVKENYNYEITYKPIIENEPQEENTEQKDYTAVGAIGTTAIILVLLFSKKKNVTIYNYQEKDWKELGKIALKGQTIKLDKYHYKAKTNRYRIVLDNKIVDKLDGRILKIQRNGKCSKQLINKKNNITPYRIDIVI